VNVDDVELALAKRLQQIDHNGRHTWESCHQSARDRNLAMARAALGFVAEMIDADDRFRGESLFSKQTLEGGGG
jgi:hypothetical protein